MEKFMESLKIRIWLFLYIIKNFLIRQVYLIQMTNGHGTIWQMHLSRFMIRLENMDIWHMHMIRLDIGILFIRTEEKS